MTLDKLTPATLDRLERHLIGSEYLMMRRMRYCGHARRTHAALRMNSMICRVLREKNHRSSEAMYQRLFK